MNYYGAVMKKYATFSGRARRAEYWQFTLVNTIIMIILAVSIQVNENLVYLYGLYAIISLLPSWGVQVRRLHDVGKSGWFLLISLIPIVGSIWMLILFCRDSENGSNRFGGNPKTTGFSDNNNVNNNWDIGGHTVPVQNNYDNGMNGVFGKTTAIVVFEQGEVVGRTINVGEESISIGRGEGNIIRYSLERSPHISGNHCRLFMRNNELHIEDFSTNGCYVLTKGGEKKHINNRNEILRAGDALYIGSSNTKLAIRNIGV